MVGTSHGDLRTAGSPPHLARVGWPGRAPFGGIAFAVLFSFAFFPLLAPLVWTARVSIVLIRRPALARAA